MAAIATMVAAPEGQGEEGSGEARGGCQEDHGESPHPRQPAGAVEARGARGRQLPDRLPATDRDPRPRARAASRDCPPTRCSRRIHEQFRAYRATLQDDRRHLLERFEVIDVARKVVGVGSVGTRAFIVLLQGRDQQDPLFLQVKEATTSVLEDHLPKSRYKQPGERVVQGQRMMQAASDIYLGWTKGVEANRYLYWRQLRDMKGSADVEAMKPFGLDVLRAPMRLDARTRARPVGRSRRDRRVPRQERHVRPVDHRLLRALRGSERPGLSRPSPTRSSPGGWKRSRASEPRSIRATLRACRCPSPCAGAPPACGSSPSTTASRGSDPTRSRPRSRWRSGPPGPTRSCSRSR